MGGFSVVGGSRLAAALELAAGDSPAGSERKRLYAYVSSWTSGANGGGGDGGVHVFNVDAERGMLTWVQSVAPELNAGYICITRDGRHLYATDERKDLGGKAGAGGGVVSFAVDRQTGRLERLNGEPSMGAYPAYISVDATGSCVAVANHGSYDTVARVVRNDDEVTLEDIYDDASVAVFGVDESGRLQRLSDVATLERGPAIGWDKESGIAAVFQASPHAHSVNFDPSGQYALVCDKGKDRIYVYRVVRGGTGPKFMRASVFATPPGTAPRHSAFHPMLPFVYIINELEPSLSVYGFDGANGRLTAIQTVATVAAAETRTGQDRSMPADVHVHPNGRFVYGSTRGNNTIACYRVDARDGRLSTVEIGTSGGKTPRGFNLEPSGRFLFAGNQDSNQVTVFAVDPESGRLVATGGKTEVPRPVCIRFAWV